MVRSLNAGRDTLTRWLIVAILFLVPGCGGKNQRPQISSTPVATPIIVGTTPAPSETPTPKKMIDSSAQRELTLEQVSEAIEKARNRFPGNTGIYFIDVESNKNLDYAGERQFESASLMKMVVIAELYRRIQVGQLELEQPLVLKQHQIVGGSGDLKDQEPGVAFPLRVLAEKMITQSDNTATQMLTDLLTKDALNKSMKNLGLTGTTINRDVYDFAAIDRGQDNYTTAKDMALLMKQLATEELAGSSDIHAVLERQQRNDMIGAGFPKDVRVAHKTGELNGILHDVGVVYAGKGPYVLAMLSDGVTNKAEAIDTFAQLSKEILALYQSHSPSPTPSEE